MLGQHASYITCKFELSSLILPMNVPIIFHKYISRCSFVIFYYQIFQRTLYHTDKHKILEKVRDDSYWITYSKDRLDQWHLFLSFYSIFENLLGEMYLSDWLLPWNALIVQLLNWALIHC